MRAVRARGARRCPGTAERRRSTRRRLAAALAATLVLLAPACSGGDEPEAVPSTTPSSTGPRPPLSFGALGPPAEEPVWQDAVESWNEKHPGRVVRMDPDFNHDRLLEQITAGQVPDVFVARREDLEVLTGAELVQPVDELLDQRGVDFGDGYSRDALQLFSADEGLQCMPLSASPLVMYVNTELFDVETMLARGLDAPRSQTRWTFDQMAAVAEFSIRPRAGVRGLYVDPSVRGLAPYVLSAGGSVFDDEEQPTGLDLSDGDSASGIEQLLQLVRSPQVSPTAEQLERYSPRELFERGQLTMLAGYRSLTPKLRQNPEVDFDVREMPFLGTDATIGDVTGLCLAASTEDPGNAADFLVHLLRADTVGALARTGYTVPSSLEVAQSGQFLQRTRRPEHAEVFLNAIRDIRPLPPMDYGDLEDVVGEQVRRLFDAPVIDLTTLLDDIDESSRELLDPEYEPEDTASESAGTESDSGG